MTLVVCNVGPLGTMIQFILALALSKAVALLLALFSMLGVIGDDDYIITVKLLMKI